jgi:hypothetical protein
MRTGSTRSVVFSPIPEPSSVIPADPEAPAARTRLHEEPTDPLLLYGEMLRDGKVIADLLKELPMTANGGYHGTLRAVIGAAERIKRRAVTLSGE